MEVNTIVKTTGASSLTNEIADLLNKNVENDENAFMKKSYDMEPKKEKNKVVEDAIVFFDNIVPFNQMPDNIIPFKQVEDAIEFF